MVMRGGNARNPGSLPTGGHQFPSGLCQGDLRGGYRDGMTAPDRAPSALGPFAEPAAARDHFEGRLRHETDPSDVAAALAAGEPFALLDVRGDAAWHQGHAVGALHLPRTAIAARARELDPGIPLVVYCWGPACNGGVKAAAELAARGFAVKEMLGGFEYWAREGLPVESASGPVPRAADPLTAPIEGGADAVLASIAHRAPAGAAAAIACDC